MSGKLAIQCPQNKLFDAAVQVIKTIRERGFDIYIVGGAVRDLVLNRLPDDIDMVTTAHPEDIKNIFPDAEMVGACFGVVLVKYNGSVFELATCREERLYSDGRRPDEVRFTTDFRQDVLRRDFTVNAMLYDPLSGEVIDYVGGLPDLRNRVIRAIGNAAGRFSEDYLRMLRAVRFAARLDFQIHPEAWQAICNMANKTALIAAERVRCELESMLTGSDPARAMELLKASRILKLWLPEVDALAGVAQHPVYHPEGDVWQHTMLMLKNAAKPCSVEFAWSILLHDIGKKPTFELDKDNIPHFYGHEACGAEMIGAIAQRLRFSRELTDTVEHAVRWHMRFASVMEMREAKLKRLMAEKYFAMELELHKLDCQCSNGLTATCEFLRQKLKKMENCKLPPPLLNGRDLIKMGLVPGREFKEILNAVMDAQLEKRLNSKNGAVEWVKKNFLR
ncbi:MAG: CCA tRNA nucleotidyltransferase [Lentisphaeria bacterium]|nr:CCA tRNA nucleotidyltransferase [Lentisphaeria bacterium]